jgi:hypothetical protein
MPNICGTPVAVAKANDVLKVLGTAFVPSGKLEPASDWILGRAKEVDTTLKLLADPGAPKNAALILCQQSCVPRMNFYARTHAPVETQVAMSYFDSALMSCLEAIVGCTMDNRAKTIASLPTRLGGLGLTRMSEVATYAHSCVGVKGRQKEISVENAEKQRAALFSTLSGVERAVVLSGSAMTSARVIRDGEIALTDRATEIFVRERLLLQVASAGAKCVCGVAATNAHIQCCERIPGGPRTRRHDLVVQAIASSMRSLGMEATVEPRISQVRSRARPDILCRDHVTDVTVRFCAPASVTEPRQFAAAEIAERQKTAQWAAWSRARDLKFAPLVLENTGAMTKASYAWLRSAVAGQDCVFTTGSAANWLVACVLRAAICGNTQAFVAAMVG